MEIAISAVIIICVLVYEAYKKRKADKIARNALEKYKDIKGWK